MNMRAWVDFALRLREIDEVGWWLLAAKGLGEGVLFGSLVVVMVGSERDDVTGGLRHLQLPVSIVEQVLLVLVSREFLEELG